MPSGKRLTLAQLQAPDAPLTVSAENISYLIGVSPQALRMACRSGKMPYECIIYGSHVRITTASFLAAHNLAGKETGCTAGTVQPDRKDSVSADLSSLSLS